MYKRALANAVTITKRGHMNLLRRLAIAGSVVGVLLGAATASAAPATANFQATFVDIYSQCPIGPPVVFCGHGAIAGFGQATSTVHLTAPPTPIPGTDCLAISAIRTITLDDGSGSLTLDETGTKCPPSDAATNAPGDPFTVAKTYTIASSTGVFAGATGSGTDTNRSAGNSQVSVISGSITLL